MTKSWRPKGWENPHRDTQSIYNDGRNVVRTDFLAYEAGADAILAALRKSGWRAETEPDQMMLKYRALQDMWVTAEMEKVTVCFIPDDED